MKARLVHSLLIAGGGAAVAVALFLAGWLEWLENPLWDLRARWLAQPSAHTSQIRLIFLDQTALDYQAAVNQQRWPWYRQTYADGILAFCRRSRPKAVVFDWLFTEPSMYGVEDDLAFAEGIAQTTGFVAAAFFSSEQGLLEHWPETYASVVTPTIPALEAWLKTAPGRSLTVRRASLPIPGVLTNAAQVGNVSGTLAADAVIRRVIPFRVFDGRIFPSLGLAAYLAAHPQARLELTTDGLTVDGRIVPMDRQGRVILRYRGPSQTHPVVSAHAVINSELRLQEGSGRPEISPDFFNDAYVFFGATAPGLFDLKVSPTDQVYPGVEVHATFLDNLLAGDFARATPFWATVLLTLLAASAAGVGGRFTRAGWPTVILFATLLPAPLLAGVAAYAQGWWLPVAPAITAGTVGLVTSTVVNYAVEGRQKRFLKNAFKRYLSPAVIEQLLQHPDRLSLGGEERELTIFFSDVRGFTGISESLTPQALTALLNEYLTTMTDLILEQGGTVDKYIGDAIVAFWNAPVAQPDHAIRAVRAALQCQQRLNELRPRLRERYGHEIYCRIGLNTGCVVVGNLGSHQRFDYSFLGDAGNLASRLEGINKVFGTFVLISEATRRLLGKDVPAREISRVRVVGRAEPVRIFEPLTAEQADTRRTLLEAFAEGLSAYYAGRFDEALRRFESIAAEDPPAAAYVAHCRHLLAQPPPRWDGIWDMKEK